MILQKVTLGISSVVNKIIILNMNFKARFNNIFKARIKDNINKFVQSNRSQSYKGSSYFNVYLLNKVHGMNFLTIRNSMFIMNALCFLKNNNNHIALTNSEGALVTQLNGILI
jgi:hypothetical protein